MIWFDMKTKQPQEGDTILLAASVQSTTNNTTRWEYYVAENTESGVCDIDGEHSLPWELEDFDYWMPIDKPESTSTSHILPLGDNT